MCPLQAQPHCSSVKQGTNVTSTKDDVLDVLLRRENHLCLADFLHFSLNRVINHGKITANHPKSHQHPEVLRNLVLAQLYVYALIQLFSRLDDCTEFDPKDQDCRHHVGPHGTRTQCMSANTANNGRVRDRFLDQM